MSIKDIKACLSHKTDNWRTPNDLYNAVKELGYYDTFPYECEYNEFDRGYYFTDLFINPPFSKLDKVGEWVIEQVKHGCKVLLLIPARTDTKYFHKMLRYNPVIFFIKGRLHYNESKLSAPFPTIMMVFGLQDYYTCYKSGEMEDLIAWLREIS